jgi:hypothetical protein
MPGRRRLLYHRYERVVGRVADACSGRHAVVWVGAKLAAAFRQERVCPPSQYL